MNCRLLLLAGLFLAACTADSKQQKLKFEDAWVRSTPPGAMMTAGFGRLVNHTEELLVITAYSSPAYGEVSLHQTVIENDVSQMREVHALTIPPGEAVELAPGGYHLMLMKPTQTSDLPQFIELYLETAGGRQFNFNLPLERR